MRSQNRLFQSLTSILITTIWICVALSVPAPDLRADPVVPLAPETCIANGDINCGGDIGNIGDMSHFIDYLFFSHFSLLCPSNADMTGDCVIDREDFAAMGCFFDFCWPSPPCCEFPETCCSPIAIFSGDTALVRGEADMTWENGTATVTNIGTTGGDGVRLYPNMAANWRLSAELVVENTALLAEGAELSVSFTGADTTLDLEPVAWFDARHEGSDLTLTAGFNRLSESIVSVSAYEGVSLRYSGLLPGNEVELTGNPLADWPSITEVSLAIVPRTNLITRPTLRVMLDRPVEFSIIGESPPILFEADRFEFIVGSDFQPFLGLGPLDITARSMDWFAVSFGSCCQGRVGDANGLGGDEPTIGDISVIIDAKFITGSCDGVVACLEEADVNQSGGCEPTCEDVTIGDISTLIDYLFITGSELGLPDCLDCP